MPGQNYTPAQYASLRQQFAAAGDDSIPGGWMVDGTIDWAKLDSASVYVALDGVYGSISDVAANTAKSSNATHTGEVTGSGALTIANNVVDEANLKVNAPTDDYLLTADSGASGGMKWAALTQSWQVPDDASVASAANVGTLRYRVVGTTPTANTYLDVSMQTGPATYAWVNIVTQGVW